MQGISPWVQPFRGSDICGGFRPEVFCLGLVARCCAWVDLMLFAQVFLLGIIELEQALNAELVRH